MKWNVTGTEWEQKRVNGPKKEHNTCYVTIKTWADGKSRSLYYHYQQKKLNNIIFVTQYSDQANLSTNRWRHSHIHCSDGNQTGIKRFSWAYRPLDTTTSWFFCCSCCIFIFIAHNFTVRSSVSGMVYGSTITCQPFEWNILMTITLLCYFPRLGCSIWTGGKFLYSNVTS